MSLRDEFAKAIKANMEDDDGRQCGGENEAALACMLVLLQGPWHVGAIERMLSVLRQVPCLAGTGSLDLAFFSSALLDAAVGGEEQ